MYLALFFMPWVLIYALSTITMNHREHLRAIYGEGPPRFVPAFERSYPAAFSDEITPQQKAAQILRDLGLEGFHNVSRPSADGTITINRHDPVTPMRIVYRPGEAKISAEKMEFQTPAFLERMHRRRGFQQPFVSDDVWAVLVDAFIAAMVFWAASGLWMWWEMKVTRPLGAICIVGGLVVFALFLVRI
jgi:hypothetical protein